LSTDGVEAPESSGDDNCSSTNDIETPESSGDDDGLSTNDIEGSVSGGDGDGSSIDDVEGSVSAGCDDSDFDGDAFPCGVIGSFGSSVSDGGGEDFDGDIVSILGSVVVGIDDVVVAVVVSVVDVKFLMPTSF